MSTTHTYSDYFVCFPRHASGRVAHCAVSHSLSLSVRWSVGPLSLVCRASLPTMALRRCLGSPGLSPCVAGPLGLCLHMDCPLEHICSLLSVSVDPRLSPRLSPRALCGYPPSLPTFPLPNLPFLSPSFVY